MIGSTANEVHAVEYVLNYVNEIKRNSTRSNDVLIDHQISSGTVSPVQSMVSGRGTYLNLQNVVVKLQGESNHSVLINSHFDSVPGSPGGSDAIVSESIFKKDFFFKFLKISRS